MDSINVLHSVPGVGKTSFGLGQVVKSLAKAQLDSGNNVDIWCVDSAEEIKWAAEISGFPLCNIRAFPLAGPRFFLFTPQMERAARALDGKKYNVIHQHGIWTGISRATVRFRENYGVPTVIAPHGSLNKWALNRSSWKKKIALLAYESGNLRHSSCLHATSETEISDFRDFGLVNPIAYIENGVSEECLYCCGDAEEFRKEYNLSPDTRIILFLSRITPKKGLVMLIESINKIRSSFSGWQLIIAGLDEFGHKAELESLISKLGLNNVVKIIGTLFDQSKADAFSAADLFVLPSLSEGFPMVVLDSLAAGVPVMTTKSSSWEDLNTYNCGWWVDICSDSICDAVREAISLSVEELQEMGQRGKQLISSKYIWSKLATKTLELYSWLLHRRDRPDFVLLD